MKVTKSHSECFKPFVLNISVENEEEAEAVRELFGFNVTVPEYLSREGYITNERKDILDNMFRKVYNLL